MLQPELLLAIATALRPGFALFVQSDVLAVIEPMVTVIEASGCFVRPGADGRPWRSGNPLPVPTEREQLVMQQGWPVYRVLYQRTDAPPPTLDALQRDLAEPLEQTDTDADNPCSSAAAP